MALGAAMVLIVQFLFCLIPYSRVDVGGMTLSSSIFKDNPALMFVSFAILLLAIFARYKEKIEPFVLGSVVLYGVYFIVKPIVVMITLEAAAFSPIVCILLSIVAIGLSIKGIVDYC